MVNINLKFKTYIKYKDKLKINIFLGVNVANANAKSSPTIKSTPKDQKMFSSGKTIDPAWLAQTKMETANMVNAHKLLVSNFVSSFYLSAYFQLQSVQVL